MDFKIDIMRIIEKLVNLDKFIDIGDLLNVN